MEPEPRPKTHYIRPELYRRAPCGAVLEHVLATMVIAEVTCQRCIAWMAHQIDPHRER